MDAGKTPPPEEEKPDDENALESSETEVSENALESTDDSDSGVVDATSKSGGGKAPEQPAPKKRGLLNRFNIYLLLFIFVLIIAAIIVVIAYFQSKQAASTSTLKTQNLTQQTLDQVASSDSTVGSSGQVLNVESSAVFAGKVLVRQDLEVAGSLEIGGAVALTDISVSGTSALGQVSISKDISVSGNAAIQGGMTIAKSLQVNGGGTFGGGISAPQLTTTNFQLNGDLVLTHHIIAGGPSPAKSNGSALGSGGTSTVSGSDTSGSISINIGSSPISGCFITVIFASKYASTPHILITPIGAAAGGLAYYVNRDTTGFSICDSQAPPTGSSFGFDYFVVD